MRISPQGGTNSYLALPSRFFLKQRSCENRKIYFENLYSRSKLPFLIVDNISFLFSDKRMEMSGNVSIIKLNNDFSILMNNQCHSNE